MRLVRTCPPACAPALGAVGFPSLNVRAPVFGEALHGVCGACGRAVAGSTGCATSFPHATAMGASFNRTLWAMVGDVIGLEGRALRNEQGGGGVTYFAPNVNLYVTAYPPLEMFSSVPEILK